MRISSFYYSAVILMLAGSCGQSLEPETQQENPPTRVEVSSVTLNKTELSLEKGVTETLTATVAPDNATDKTVVWSSSDASVASVEYGKVTALKSGSVTITAKAGDKNATCRVSVFTPVESVSMDRTSVSLEEGQTITLVATVNPADADDKTVNWSSSNTEVAIVEGGKVVALREGEATIVATAGGKSASCTVTVTKEDVPFSITPTSVEVEAAGGIFTVTVSCSAGYHMSSKPDWVTEKSVSNKVHTFEVAANSSTAQRSGVIVFCDDKEGVCLPCNVKQKAGDPGLAGGGNENVNDGNPVTW